MGQSNITTLMKTDDATGNGHEAVAGRRVTVHYTGWLYDQGKPITRARSSTVRATVASRFPSGSARVKSSGDGTKASPA